VPSTCGGPEAIGVAKSYCVDEPISTWKNYVSSLNIFERGRCSQGPPTSIGNTSAMNFYMVKCNAHIETKTQYYRTSKYVKKGKEATNPPVPLQIEKMMGETMTCIHKGAFKKSYHNPNTRATHKYSMVKDLAQTPCVISTLEVLQSFLSQRKAL
jgi:hypothetical protein